MATTSPCGASRLPFIVETIGKRPDESVSGSVRSGGRAARPALARTRQRP
jgi:hypothetical protein